MKAVVCERGELSVADLPDPAPAQGQVLLRVERCGICGSDLHARHHADEAADVIAEAGYDGFMRHHERVVLGHELSGEVLDHGPGCTKELKAGTPVVAVPLRRNGSALHALGLSASAPGAYAEQVVVEEPLMFAVPNGLPLATAALTEPMAVAWHAVRRSEIAKGDVAVVVGCGPVGLSVIAMLKARGVRTVVASDLSPARRALATACGADVVVDPEVEPVHRDPAKHKHVTGFAELAGLGLDVMTKLRRGPLPWQHVMRVAEKLGAGPKRPVVFECVGVPGMIDDVIGSAPLMSRVVVVGVCMTPDTFRPSMAINKEIDLRFVVGYTPLEYRDTLHLIADGKVVVDPLVTGTVGLGGVAGAFDALAGAPSHAKVLIDPASTATL